MNKILSITTALYILLAAGCSENPRSLGFYTGNEGPGIAFAMEAIDKALSRYGITLQAVEKGQADIVLDVEKSMEGLNSEGYSLSKEGSTITVIGIDPAGVMYGGLELAEQIELYGIQGIKKATENPYMELRGSKFNVPLDVRTPSYSDYSDVAQNNMKEMWSFDFWKEYIDNMARYRYNFISLWSLHPFPSMVKVPGYEDIALDDVHRSKGPFREYYNLRGEESEIPELVNNYEVLKNISIDGKIDHWRRVMEYGKSRNIDFYIVTWNIFTNGIDGKYGITDKADNEVTRDYVKKSIRQLFVTYPDLAGVGLTTGENMGGLTVIEKEEWAFETYGKALLEIADEMPERRFTLIHRQHFANPEEIARKFRPLVEKENVEFIYSFKYAKAHVFSTTRQPYHEDFVENIGDLKTIWTLRNDDAYYFRWGAPDFVREFMLNIPHQVSRGYYYGSDQWIWGREFTTREAGEPRQLEVVKHWYNWMMWGRLGYNPDLSNDRFSELISARFPGVDAGTLFKAWQEASMIYPVTTAFHWGRVDFMWYIEGCRSNAVRSANNETGFHDVDLFIEYPVHPYSGCQTIPDYVKGVVSGDTGSLTGPLEVSRKLHNHSDRAMDLISGMDAGENTELQRTLNDIKAISHLGKYYARKIAGSTYVALYRETRDKAHQDKAVKELNDALESWKLYTRTALEQHINPIWTNRVGYVNWEKTTDWVKQDIEIARSDID